MLNNFVIAWAAFFCFFLYEGLFLAGDAKESKKKQDKSWTPPWFDVTLPDLIQVTEGQTSKLVCTVHKLRGRSVSWIRQKDLHVISANTLTFTSDDRFQIVADNATSTWTLKISPTLRDDAGIYECQVNTRPKLSWPVVLEVEVPAAQLEGPAERYIQSGSTLVLTCNSTLHPDAVSSVIWHHNGTAVNMSSPRGGLSIQTVREGRHVVSRLSLVRAGPTDAGVYMCAPDLVHPANATVFVVEGEHRAATHHDGSATKTSCLWMITIVLILIRDCTFNHIINLLSFRRLYLFISVLIAIFLITSFSIYSKERLFVWLPKR